MNTYQLFTTMRDHMLAQGRTAMRLRASGHPGCAYRGDDGTKCAVGCLITDEFYNPSLEGLGVHEPEQRTAVEKSIGRTLTKKELSLLVHMQQLHDLAAGPYPQYSVSEWPREFENVERKFFPERFRNTAAQVEQLKRSLMDLQPWEVPPTHVWAFGSTSKQLEDA